MARKNKVSDVRDQVSEERKPEDNNWEIPDEWAGVPELNKNVIAAWEKVDPEIRRGNPVWKWSYADGQYIFVFRNGQKVRIMGE